MTTKCNFQLSPVHPPIGMFIDGGSLQLVEVLGVGGYGVVYRAIEARPSTTTPKSYAVKCLVTAQVQNPRSRQVHIREIALHQLASRHPGVVTLHKVVECLNFTYIIMDYAPDHDLFTQILHSCRYLGDDALIRYVFLQLIDAVEYCHSLGIYHRDLKPENILCYDDGLRIAITDFGLATTEKVSDEFRTGSVFHMSPECQGTAFALQGNYSPMHNDIWSLGIILLNLATGRNPWKSATADDPTFQAYLRSPNSFLPSVLPISSEVNKILVGMLDIDYRRRLPLREVRRAISQVKSFYSDGAIFEGSMARCPWESGMDIDTDSSEDMDLPAPHSPSPAPNVASRWSKETISDIIFARQPLRVEESTYDQISWNNRSSCGATWAYGSTDSSSSSESDPSLGDSNMFGGSRTPSETSIQSPYSSLPTTPNSADIAFGSKAPEPNRKPLKINTNLPRPCFYDNDACINSFSEDSAMMQTAIEYDPYSSMFYLTSALSRNKFVPLPVSAATAADVVEDKEMTSTWQELPDASSPSIYSRASSRTSSSSSVSPRSTNPQSSRTPMLSPPSVFLRSNSPSPEPEWSPFCPQPRQAPDSFITEQSSHTSSHHHHHHTPPSSLITTLLTRESLTEGRDVLAPASQSQDLATSSDSNSFLGHHHQRGARLMQRRRRSLIQRKSLLSPMSPPIVQSHALKTLPALAQGSRWGVFASNPLNKLLRLPAPMRVPTLRVTSPVDRSLHVIRNLIRRLTPRRLFVEPEGDMERGSVDTIWRGSEHGKEVGDPKIRASGPVLRRSIRPEIPFQSQGQEVV